MSLIDLPCELLYLITTFLSNHDVMSLSSCSKTLLDLVFMVRFTDKVNFEHIKHLLYIDSFTNVWYPKPAEIFPINIQYLEWNFSYQIPRNTPKSLTSLKLRCYCNRTHVNWEKTFCCCKNKNPWRFPDSILHLELAFCSNERIHQLPPNLETLELGVFYNEPLPQLPKTLKYLILGYIYNLPLPSLPNSLIHLRLGKHYDCLLPQLPNSLLYLKLGCRYDQPLPALPDSLVYFDIGCKFNREYPKFPPSLRHTRMSRYHTIFNYYHMAPPTALTMVEDFKLYDCDDHFSMFCFILSTIHDPYSD